MGGGGTSDVAGGEGYLKVVASGVSIEVEKFAYEIKAGNEARLHGLGVDFFGVNTALGDDGGVVVARAGEVEFHIL